MTPHQRLIKDKGLLVDLVRNTGSTYNTTTRKVVPIKYTCPVIAYFYSGQDLFSSGDSFTETHKKALVSPVQTSGVDTPIPDVGDVIVSAVDRYEIIDVCVNRYKDKVIFYTCTVRG